MRFEVGHEYRTRDGRRARVYATDGYGGTIHGAVWSSVEMGWVAVSWELGGECLRSPETDLMPPEPERRTVWASVYPDQGNGGTWSGFLSSTRLLADERANNRPGRIACVPVTFTEGEGLSLMADCFRAKPKIDTAELLGAKPNHAALIAEAREMAGDMPRCKDGTSSEADLLGRLCDALEGK